MAIVVSGGVCGTESVEESTVWLLPIGEPTHWPAKVQPCLSRPNCGCQEQTAHGGTSFRYIRACIPDGSPMPPHHDQPVFNRTQHSGPRNDYAMTIPRHHYALEFMLKGRAVTHRRP